MDRQKGYRHLRNKVLYTLFALAMLCTVFFSMITYIYISAENDGYENLHIQTKEIKENIEFQITSDRENLLTMSRFAANLYSNGESFDLLFDSFHSIGLIENIGILLPDNTFITKIGTIKAPKGMSFENELKRGEYISGRIKDATNPNKEILRSAVPVIADGKTVAILYGAIDLDTFEKKYLEKAKSNDAQLYVVEKTNGNFIINTNEGKLGNLSSLESRKYNKSFSFEQMREDISQGNSGYTSFISAFTGKTLYMHYSPLAISDWHIMLAEPEATVFTEAHTAGANLSMLFLVIVFIMLLYLLLMFNTEKVNSQMNLYASKIRKLLLGINQDAKCITDALKIITEFAKSGSAFYVDTDGEGYEYIVPGFKGSLLTGDDRKYFNSKLVDHVRRLRKDRYSTTITLVKINANSKLQKKGF